MTRKVLVSIDDRLVRRVDAAAKRLGMSRSAFFSQLAERAVGSVRSADEQRRIDEAFEQLRQLRRRAPRVHEPAAKAVRRLRDERGEHLARNAKS